MRLHVDQLDAHAVSRRGVDDGGILSGHIRVDRVVVVVLSAAMHVVVGLSVTLSVGPFGPASPAEAAE